MLNAFHLLFDTLIMVDSSDFSSLPYNANLTALTCYKKFQRISKGMNDKRRVNNYNTVFISDVRNVEC